MITSDALKEYLELLKTYGIRQFKCSDFELLFHAEHPQVQPSQLIEDKASESLIPLDLRTDNINSYDSVMNWSSPPSAEMAEPELPLTGDIPL